MASFDIIDAAGFGYRLAWRERRYLLRMALVPMVLDFICLTVIATQGWEFSFLRQGLVLLPASFAQGWMLSHYIRLIFLGQRWPFRPTGEPVADRAALTARMEGIAGGTLMFAVSRFLLAGLVAVLYRFELKAGQDPAAISPAAAVGALVLLIGSVWGVRLLWLFIPAALRHSPLAALRGLGGWTVSFYLGAVMLICSLPLMMGAGFTITLLDGVTGQGAAPTVLGVGALIIRAAMDMAVALVATGGIAQGFRVMLGGEKVGA